MSLVVRKPVFGVSDLVRHKLSCAATEAAWRLEISDLEIRGIVLSMLRENKGADQFCGYQEADLRLCFRRCKKAGFLTNLVADLQYGLAISLSKGNKGFKVIDLIGQFVFVIFFIDVAMCDLVHEGSHDSSVVELPTTEREVRGSNPMTAVNYSVLEQDTLRFPKYWSIPRKLWLCPKTEKLLTGTLNKKTKTKPST